VSAIGAAPVPRPLPSSLFDMALMPEKLWPWAEDLAERMQCPPDYIGVSLMVSVAAVIGRKVAVRPLAHDDWTVICNQWGLISEIDQAAAHIEIEGERIPSQLATRVAQRLSSKHLNEGADFAAPR
jgi:hypothetical protein